MADAWPVCTYDLLVTWDLKSMRQTTKGRKEGVPRAQISSFRCGREVRQPRAGAQRTPETHPGKDRLSGVGLLRQYRENSLAIP